jgi:hypothetical protein
MSMKITLEFEERDTSLFSTIAELAVECGASSVNVDMGRQHNVIDASPRRRRTTNNLVHHSSGGIDIERSLDAFSLTEDDVVRTRTTKGSATHRLKMAILRRQSMTQKCADTSRGVGFYSRA